LALTPLLWLHSTTGPAGLECARTERPGDTLTRMGGPRFGVFTWVCVGRESGHPDTARLEERARDMLPYPRTGAPSEAGAMPRERRVRRPDGAVERRRRP
jgi:hypothetical protein